MSGRQGFRTLVLATSYAPELRRPELRPKEYPRTDYVALSRVINCDILDYAIYDDSAVRRTWRRFERKFRLDFHLAALGYRRAAKYDVVLLMSEQVAIPYMMLQRMLGRRAATVYVSAHSSRKQAKLVRSLRLFDGLDIAVSNACCQRQFLTESMRIPDERIRCVHYAVDESFFVPEEGTSAEYVLSAGIANRDYATLFEAVKGMPIRVKIAAGGRFYSLGAARSLPPRPENVEFVPPTDAVGMRRLHQRAAVVVVPLLEERMDATGCSVVLEAMACAKPVAAGRTMGIAEYVRDGQTGLLVDRRDPGEMRFALTRLLESDDLQRKLGAQGRAESEGRFAFRTLVQGLARASQEACDSA